MIQAIHSRSLGRTRALAALCSLAFMLVCVLFAGPEPALAAYSFTNCASCHTTYPGAHSLSNCTACHASYTANPDPGDYHWPSAPTPAGNCLGCHDVYNPSPYVHGLWLDPGWAYAPQSPLSRFGNSVSPQTGRTYPCDSCHVPSRPTVPQHDSAQLAVVHEGDIGGTSCESCHNNSLGDVVGHTSCLTCHGPAAPAIAQAAVTTGDTRCVSCHPAYAAVHEVAHASVSVPTCAFCHNGGAVDLHADCSTCHTPAAPVGATCVTCHPTYTEPHGAGVRTWGVQDYYTWGSVGRSGSLLSEVGDNPTNPGVHGNYLATTAKCGICHSVHRAYANGVKLLNSSVASCQGCHAIGTTVTGYRVNVGQGASDSPHIGTLGASCNSRGCHVDNPHGANGSQYAIVAAKLLSKSADDYLSTKAVDQPGSGITLALMNGDAGWDESVRSAVRTGYTCNIEGCHYQTLLAVVAKNWSEDRKGQPYDTIAHRPVTGHLSVGAAVPGAASYTPLSSCVSCHDQTDSNAIGYGSTVQGYTFPHGQRPSAGSTNNTGGNRAYLWYTTAGDALGAGASYFTAPNDKAKDGACLKCHRDGLGEGIGLNH